MRVGKTGNWNFVQVDVNKNDEVDWPVILQDVFWYFISAKMSQMRSLIAMDQLEEDVNEFERFIISWPFLNPNLLIKARKFTGTKKFPFGRRYQKPQAGIKVFWVGYFWRSQYPWCGKTCWRVRRPGKYCVIHIHWPRCFKKASKFSCNQWLWKFET